MEVATNNCGHARSSAKRQELKQRFDRLRESIPNEFVDAVESNTCALGEMDRWRQPATIYLNGGLKAVGLEDPNLFRPLVVGVMAGISEPDADYDWFRSLLMDELVDGLNAYDPAKGANLVPFLRKRLLWRYLDLVRDQSNRRRAVVDGEPSSPAYAEPIVVDDEQLAALRAIIVGTTAADQALLRQLGLSETHRAFLYLRYFCGLACAEIAERLCRNPRAVSNSLKLARTRLQRLAKTCDNDLANLRWRISQRPAAPFSRSRRSAHSLPCSASIHRPRRTSGRH